MRLGFRLKLGFVSLEHDAAVVTLELGFAARVTDVV